MNITTTSLKQELKLRKIHNSARRSEATISLKLRLLLRTAELNAMDGDISGATAKASIVGVEAVIAMKAAATVVGRRLMCCGRKDGAVENKVSV
jgi:hypothetical protein